MSIKYQSHNQSRSSNGKCALLSLNSYKDVVIRQGKFTFYYNCDLVCS